MKSLAMLLLASAIAVPAAFGQGNGQLQSAVQKQLKGSQFKNVQVSTQGDDVSLTGTVKSYEDKLQAEKKVHKVHGVAAINDQIQVGGPEIPDAQLQSKVIDRVTNGLLEANVPVQFQTVMIRVHNGVVDVGGHVAGPIAANGAMSAIDDTPGVKGVVDHLKVDPVSPMDMQLRRAVYRAVYSSPFLTYYALNPSKPVRIQVENGHVELYGVVDSEGAKNTAGIKANSVPGVFSVKNSIVVANQKNEKPAR
jgi:hyperosmotically inducible periplasmic protein